jgi:hypothetical protein
MIPFEDIVRRLAPPVLGLRPLRSPRSLSDDDRGLSSMAAARHPCF